MDDRLMSPVAHLRRLGTDTAATAVILAGALMVAGVFVVIAGKDPLATFASLLGYPLGTANGFAEVIVRTIPLTLAGLGVVIAFRANVFNVGADGQLIIGAVLATACVGLFAHAPWWIAAPVYLALGFAGGAAFGAFAGWLRAQWGASEIIVTIMLNYVALQILGWVIRGPLQERDAIFPRSDAIPDAAMLDILIEGTRIHWGLLVAVAATVLIYVVLRFSTLGFQLTVVGLNANAARYGGINDRAIIVVAMLLSGGLAGLAGAGEIASLHGRLQDNFAPGFGVLAIAVALLARLNPLAVPLSALLFGVLHVGSGAVQRSVGLPFPIVWIIEGAVIFGFLGVGAIREGGLAILRPR